MAGELQKLKARHRVIARMLVAGFVDKDICDILGMTPANMRAIRKSELFMRVYGELSVEADKSAISMGERINKLKSFGLDRVEEVLKSSEFEDKALQLKSAFDILNRGEDGHKIPDKVIEQNTFFDNRQQSLNPTVIKALGKHMVDNLLGTKEKGNEANKN